jgi:hypothetical protein
MEVFHEQLAIALPRLTAEECEMVDPAFALSQLMPDPLRRAFLDRCAEVGAGLPLADIISVSQTDATPDIRAYHEESARRRRRLKYIRNIFIIEGSVRKEQFSFFKSLPDKVSKYMDAIHDDALKLPRVDVPAFAHQIAEVLGQLGVQYELGRPVGPMGLHVIAKATNPHAERKEIVYECSDLNCYYMDPNGGQSTEPLLIAPIRMRHKLLERMGQKLTHIDVFEWRSMSDAHRVNFMVKLQSL